MAVNNTTSQQDFNHQQTYSAVMKELGSSAKELIQSEVNLMVAELKWSGQRVGVHLGQVVLFGFLMALSILPFLAFLVIGIGDWMGDQYWLSSLIVALACVVIGGPLALRAWRKLKEEDLSLPHLKSSFERERAVAIQKMEDLKHAMKGDRHESH
jgi:hypothetical protein